MSIRLRSVIALALTAASSAAVVAQGIPPGPVYRAENAIVSSGSGTNLNTRVGANAFYDAGYTGSSAIVANIEAGHVWNGHETLGHVTQFINGPTASGATDRHATWVGQTIGGRLTVAGSGEFQRGIAHGATLWSGAIAESWNLVAGQYATGFSVGTYNTFFQPYVTATRTGIGGQTADVVNSSWGSTGSTNVSTGRNTFAWGIDALARDTPKVFVFSAGNDGPGSNTVGAPATGYNVISVGALGSDLDNPTYNTVSTFSSRGPNNAFNPQTNTTVVGARIRVDIAAPGQNMTLAFYGGATGGNEGNTATGGPTSYSTNVQGTSFSAPTVAGGVTLMIDAGRSQAPAITNFADARVVKAILLNAADKTAGWSNAQSNVGGVVTTGQALDVNVGAGRMNLAAALPYYNDSTSTRDVAGTNQGDLGVVGLRGYDFGLAGEGTFNSLTLPGSHPAGSSLTVTLNWFVDRAIDSFSNPTQLFELALANLNLEVWRLIGGVFDTLVAQSNSVYNNTEHLVLQDLAAGQYGIRVNYLNDTWDLTNGGAGSTRSESYGLAWNFTPVPEPGTVLGLAAAGLAAGWAVRRRKGGVGSCHS